MTILICWIGFLLSSYLFLSNSHSQLPSQTLCSFKFFSFAFLLFYFFLSSEKKNTRSCWFHKTKDHICSINEQPKWKKRGKNYEKKPSEILCHHLIMMLFGVRTVNDWVFWAMKQKKEKKKQANTTVSNKYERFWCFLVISS